MIVCNWKTELYDVSTQTKLHKSKVFNEQDRYYYIFFLGTAENARGKGLCSAIVRHYQGIARKDKVPIYLEAGNAYCRDLYKTLGFVIVGEIVTGQDKAGPDGTLVENGPGFKTWGMIWRPEYELSDR